MAVFVYNRSVYQFTYLYGRVCSSIKEVVKKKKVKYVGRFWIDDKIEREEFLVRNERVIF